MTRPNTNNYFLADNAKAVFASLVCVIAVTLLLALITFSFVKTQEEARARQILNNVGMVFRDAELTLDHLNSLAFKVCSDEHLFEMRKTLFRSRFVKEIGFYENDKLSCSTYLGILDTPFEDAKPDFVTALDDIFWINTPLQLFEQRSTGTVVRRGRYNAVLDMNSVIGFSNAQDWQLFYNGDKFYPMAGNPTLINRTLSNEMLAKSQFFSLDFILCNKTYSHTCLKVVPDYKRLMDLHAGKLFLFFLIMLMTAAFSHMVTFNFLRRRRSIEYRVKKGLQQGSFFCVYQPFVNLRTGQVIGCEVLSRFEDDFGVIFPDEFIPYIKSLDKTWEFTLDMIKKSMSELTSNPDIPEGFKVSFNLFPVDFTRNGCLDLDFVQALNTKQFKLVLEITEDEQIATQSAVKHIKSLKSKGFLFAIDDFGVGYSNLGQLQTLSCDYLKIDRSFVMEMEEHSIRSSLIPHIVSIAEGLNVELIAEGVENSEQAKELRSLSVGFGQGWLYGKPQSVENLAECVKSNV